MAEKARMECGLTSFGPNPRPYWPMNFRIPFCTFLSGVELTLDLEMVSLFAICFRP